MRTIFYATSVTLLIAAAACSDNNPATDGGPTGQLCPTTIVQATNTTSTTEGTSSKCHVDQYICVVGFQCTNNFTQQATCTCNGTTGQFSCVLANGTAVPDGVTDPTTLCLPAQPDGGNANTCPTDKTKADGTSCSNAGQQCYYSTTCTNPPRTDVCQCKGNVSGDAGLSWQCDINVCP